MAENVAMRKITNFCPKNQGAQVAYQEYRYHHETYQLIVQELYRTICVYMGSTRTVL